MGAEKGSAVLGREAELGALNGFVASETGPPALVLTGELGIGKTTLWEAGVEAARRKGLRVLVARPTEPELSLSFAGLADLLDGVDIGAVRSIPGPQRRALNVVLLRAEPGETPPEPFAVSAAVTGVLRNLAQEHRLMVAIDDVPWLDGPSAAALAFAARRLRREPVRYLLARRPGGPTDLERAIDGVRVEVLSIAGLSLGATGSLLRRRLGLSLPRRELRRLVETAGGNPLFAIELGRTAIDGEFAAFGAEVRVAGVIDELFAGRLASLDGSVRRALLAVALNPGLSIAELTGVVGTRAAEAAVAAELVVVQGGRVRPSHPLLAAVATSRAAASDSRELHRRLAGVVTDQRLRTRHLALAADEPDAELATLLTAAATAAIGRGAAHDAVELAEHALRLTDPVSADHTDRLLALAEYLAIAGEERRLRELLEPRIGEVPAGEARGRAHLLLGEAAGLAEHEERVQSALANAADAPQLRALAVATRARLFASVRVERIPEAAAWAEEALNAPEAGRYATWRAMHALAWARVLRGLPVDDLAERLDLGRERETPAASYLRRVGALRLAFRGEVDAARDALRQLRHRADERGEGRLRRSVHVELCELELRAGNTAAAEQLLAEWEEWVGLDATGYHDAARLSCEALLAAVRGRSGEAEVLAAAAAAQADAAGEGWHRLAALRARGLAAILGHDRAAAEFLGAVWGHMQREGVDDPGAFPVAPDLVEALLELGRIDEARTVNTRLAALADAHAHPWGLASAMRGEALIGLASGMDGGPLDRLRDGAARYQVLGLQFDEARTLRAAGRSARRLRKWGAARELLESSAAAFDVIGSSGWADEVRTELARVGGRRRAPQGHLTATERQVAELASQGLSNKEIAAALVVGVSTVETHLRHAYDKLDVRSRAQLARKLSRTRLHPTAQ